jgi:hypothetical protein
MVDVAHVLYVTIRGDHMLQRQFKAVFLTVSVIIMLGSTSLLAWAQDDTSWVYFPETGHTLRTPFLEFFKSTGGLARYGYPITDDFVDSQTRLMGQYFQKARLEWHPANPDPYKIQLGLLAEELGKRTTPKPVKDLAATADPSCLYFTETNHTICYKFLEYLRRAGGLDMFGYPITEYLSEDGVIVQYFQRAEMEWQPSKPVGQQIQLTNLGEIYAKSGKVPADLLAPQPPPGDIGQRFTRPTTIQARGSVLNGYAAPGGSQSAYVLVVDQLGRPVQAAAVSLIIHYSQPAGDVTLQLSPTDKQGVSIESFDAGTAMPGTVISLEFIVTYPGLKAIRTPTSYVIWYNN